MWGLIPGPWDHDLGRWKMLNQLSHPGAPLFFFFKGFIYLFMIDIEREREAETQAEGEADPMLGARRWTRSRDSRIAPWAKGRR